VPNSNPHRRQSSRAWEPERNRTLESARNINAERRNGCPRGGGNGQDCDALAGRRKQSAVGAAGLRAVVHNGYGVIGVVHRKTGGKVERSLSRAGHGA